MLKKIDVQKLRLGMHVQSFEGSWLSHSLWKTKYLLRTEEDLREILRSGVVQCWIDVDKGLDVAPEGQGHASVQGEAAGVDLAVAADPVVEESVVVTKTAKVAKPPKTDMTSELQQAAATIRHSREKITALFGEARMGRAIDTDDCRGLVEDIADSVGRNASALISLARLKTKDNYTYMHSVAVCALMVSLARQLGQNEVQAREAGFAGLLHDIGKMVMPLDVLNKPGDLTDQEFVIMKSHPERGHELLTSSHLTSATALDVCLHHHEKMDGRGYPFGLAGDRISLMARMGAVCDVYDAITSTRPYKNAWDPAGSIQRMAQWQGHFDPVVFQAFVKSVGIYPVGSLVRLQSGRLAVVVDLSEQSLVRPKLKVFFSTKSKMPIPVELLDLSSPQCKDQIVARESPSDWGFTHLDELWQ